MNAHVNAPTPKIRIAPLRSLAEFAEALSVRRLCYSRRGKIQPADQVESPQEESRRPGTLCGIFAGSRIVGSVRMFAPAPGDPLESVDVPLGSYPADLPAKASVIEISALCVLPEFRHLETFKVIYAQVHRFLVENQREWILISADEVLQKKYRFIGFRATGHSYLKPHSAFPHISIMLSNQKRFGTYGLHADPLRWNLFLRDITDELSRERKVSHGPLPRLILALYRHFALPSTLLEKAIRRRVIRA